ncbi:DUF6889 family protein [Burkholderia cepacia]|uniref:DUF6889 family protein n=1 Tax=Burkholderia cepacia TaxID=292 RepID=UPI002FE0F33F
MKSLPGGEDWLLAPVHAQMCRFESLKDGTLDLADIALMNDSLAVRADNEAAWRRRQERENG